MNTIIVPTDFSMPANNAAIYACNLARITGSSIRLVHVEQLPLTISEVPLPAADFVEMHNDTQQEILKLTERLQQYTNDKVPIICSVVTGNTVTELSEIADELQPLAVVMGMQGSGSTKKYVFGSSAEAAMHRLKCPVIVVPQDAVFKQIQNIGLACEMKNVANTIPFSTIIKLIDILDARLHILNIHPGEREDDEEQQAAWLKNKLSQLAPQMHYSHDENEEKALKKLVEDARLDMLIVIPQQHSLLGSVFHKSFTNEAAALLNIPVMAVHVQ